MAASSVSNTLMAAGLSQAAPVTMRAPSWAPPSGAPLAGPRGEVATRARAAISAGKPATALTTFLRATIGLPAWQARLGGVLTALVPRYRALRSA
jgi:hypothetical protein